MAGLSRLRKLLPWNWDIGKPPPPSPEERLEDMTARLELELIELRRVLAENIAFLKSAERRQLRADRQSQGGLDRSLIEGDEAAVLERLLPEQREFIEQIRQSLNRLEGQYAQVRGRKNWYLSRLKLALVQEKLERVTARWDQSLASEIFADLEAIDFLSLPTP